MTKSTELSPLKRAYLALEQTQAHCHELEQARVEPIAVVGMGCRLPGGADSPDAYWNLLRSGVDAVCNVPADRFNVDAHYDPDPAAPGKMYTRRGGYLREPIDTFDPQFFGISPREAESMDPQHRLLLEVAWEALEHGAQVEDRLAGSATGVFVGITSHDYADLQLAAGDTRRLGTHLITGNTHNAAAGRLSYCFGFHGPCVAIDTACSSSLVAVHLACRSLLDRECRRALAGGVNLILSPLATIALSQGRVLAADGRCRAFDAAASGMVRGEGCAVVVLKRLSDAIADGDRILALIRSSAVNQDGPSSGLTVPNGPAQEALLRQALAGAGLQPADVDYVEAHGTGTPLGDPIELRALAGVFGAAREQPLVLGSVKTNIGHLEACAGVAGLIKVVLSLQHEQIPRHLHFSEPTPHLPWRELPFVVASEARAWPRGARPRVAGVSSFGFSGVNAHVLLQEAGALAERGHGGRAPRLLALSGRSEQALRQSAQRHVDHLSAHPRLALADVCFSAGAGRLHNGHRLAVVAATTEQARASLAAFLDGHSNAGLVHGTASTAPKVAFLFTGQGSQYAGMGRELCETQPGLRRTLECCDALLRPHLARPLLDVLYGPPAATALLDEPAYAQPVLFALEYALAELWQSWGVRPAVVLGHGFGEYVAACIAGVFSLEDGLRLVAQRGRLMQQPPHDGDMRAFEATLRVPLAAPGIGFVSGYTGETAGAEVASAAYWHRHLGAPLRFAEAVAAARAKGCTAFIEMGPKPTGLELAQRSVVGDDTLWLPSLQPGRSDWQQLLESLAALYVRGARIDWIGLDRDASPRRVALPTTPFQRQRYWLDLPDQGGGSLALNLAPAECAHPLLGRRIDLAGIRDLCFESSIGRDAPVFLQDHAVFGEVVLPAAAYLEIATAAACVAFGGDAAVIDDVSFQQALRLPGQRMRTLQTVLKPDGDDTFRFEIHSRAEGTTGEPWLRHAAGSVRRPTPQPAPAAHDPLQLVAEAEVGRVVDVEAVYRGCEARGIGLGPRLRALTRAWAGGDSALGEIALNDALAFGAGAYRLHPVMLDAALQTMGAVFAGRDHGDAAGDVYLPVALDHFRVYGRAAAAGWSRVRVMPVRAAHEPSLRVDVELLAADGRCVATLAGLQMKRVDHAQWAATAAADFGDWLYQIEWQALEADPAPSDAGLPGADEIGSLVLPALTQSWVEPPAMSRYAAFLDEVEEASIDCVLAALRRLDAPLAVGQCFEAVALADSLGIAARHRRLFGRLLSMLAEVGVLARGTGGECDEWLVLADARHRGMADSIAPLRSRYPEAEAELTLLARCGEQLAEVLTGRCEPLGLLFPEGDSVSAASLYADSPGARAANGFVGQVVRALVQRLPAERTLRVLELGAGTGATTDAVLPVLSAARTDYQSTDISPLFVNRAAGKFAQQSFVSCRVLDIEKPPAAQGFAPHAVDLVIAANVLHATRDLRQALRHARELLAPGGLLVLLEGTAPLRFIDLIFGLTEGWWRFADLDLRPEHPLLDAGAWQALLGDCGFRPAGNVSAARAAGSVWSTQAVMVAEAVPIPVAADGAAQRWLILAPAGSPLAEALRQEVEAAGHAATLVLAAAGESPAGADFGIGPGCVADFERLLTRTAALPGTLVHIVDLWPSADADDPARAGVWGCEAALHLVQAVAGAGMPASPALWFVTQDAQPLGERCALRGVLQSPLAGFAKVLALEHPELRCACVDFGAENDPADAACRLLAEIRRGPTGEAQIAYRAGRRHVARLARAAAVAARPGFSIRPDATYLITGGQRGLGLETAKWLVERGARSLVLLGRTDATPEIAPELAALQRAGVVVEALQADVADAGQLARVLASIDSRLPPLRGIVHSAGVLDDGILAQQTVERFRRVLAPKVLGAWNLHVQTRGRPLDFFVMYSSLASLLGSAGQANHAAANAFLDALAHHRQALGLPALSINWGVWSDIGAAARHRVGQRVKTQGMGTIAPAQGMRILEHLLARPAAQVGVAPIDWAVFARRAGAGAHAPFFARFAAGRAPVDAAVPVVTADLGRTLAAAPEAERSARIAELVRDHVAGVLRLATGEVDTGLPLNRIGLDSLMAVELRNRLRAQLGLDVALVRFMEDTSISGLAAELAAELSQPARSVGEASSAPDEASLLARLDALSDREVDALLAATLAGSPQR